MTDVRGSCEPVRRRVGVWCTFERTMADSHLACALLALCRHHVLGCRSSLLPSL